MTRSSSSGSYSIIGLRTLMLGVDTTTSSFVFELTGSPDKVASFIALMRELGLVEVGRSGIVGMMRGADKI